MDCNCSCDNTIKITAGKNATIHFSFSSDVSSYNQARFVVREDYNKPIILDKTIGEISANALDVLLTPDDTGVFDNFLPNKDYGRYIYGLDLIDTNESVVINVFPQTGEHAPEFLVFKNATKES